MSASVDLTLTVTAADAQALHALWRKGFFVSRETLMEMLVRLTTREALHGVLSVLHARHVEARYLRYDGRTLRVGVAGPEPQLLAQIARRVDVLAVEVAQVGRVDPLT